MQKLFTILCLAITFFSQAQVSTLYVGSYTDGKSEGIYSYQFNSETGSLKNKLLVAKTKNPSFLITNAKKNHVFSVSELNDYNNSKSGAIESYKVKEDGTLEKISEMSSLGAHPCHLALNEKEDQLIVSNYTGGNFSLFSIKENGAIDIIKQAVSLNTDSIKAHTHSAKFVNNNLYVADLGINTIEHFTFNDSTYVSTNSIAMEKNSGPRHFEITKNEDYMYVINEYGNTISTLKKENTSYVRQNDVSTLRADYKEKNSCADIHLSKNENFLYGSNRGENTIAVFERNKKNGSLKKIQSISCEGNWPRNFVIGPKGNFLLVANQKSNNISVFLIDKNSGELTFIYSVESANPTCLTF